MTTLSIYRPPSTLNATISIDEKTVFVKKLMGEHGVTAEFTTPTVADIQIGDFITLGTENYYVNRVPAITKKSNSAYEHKVYFESVSGNLGRKLFISSDGLADFSYNGTASDFITLIVASINEIDPGWTVGTVDASDYQTLQFTNETCRASLTRVAEAFKFEYTITGKAISLVKAAGTTTAYSFEYGKGLGLYKITRQQVNDQNILTKVYGFGSAKNIPETYRSRAKRLVFDDSGNRYLTKNTELYGIIEGQYTDENIYPNRTGALTAASIEFDDDDNYDSRASYVEDATIDFNINDYLIEGQVATIVFKSGDMAGIECEIWKYDNALKRIYFNAYADTDGYVMPRYNGGSPLQPQAGDNYTLINMALPQSYIDTAEAALKAATQTYLDENCIPMVVYSVEIDSKYARELPLVLDAGDRVTITDAALGVDALIRVSGIEYPLVNPYQIKAIIADFVPYTLQERIIKNTITTKKEITFVDRRKDELIRRLSLRMKQLQGLLFDPDGTFDPTAIDPIAIRTMLISVGAESQNYHVNNFTIEPNYGGDPNAVMMSAESQLIHHFYSYKFGGVDTYEWVLNPQNLGLYPDLDETKPYYLYARCDKGQGIGTWYLTEEQMNYDPGDGYYYFWAGILYTPINGVRDFYFTYGATYINGRTITTGRIQSIDELNYLDLDYNQFMVGDGNASLDWNVTTPSTLTLKGAMVQSPAGTFAIIVFCGAYDPLVTYQKGNQVTYEGSSWNFINETPTAGEAPAENAYWTQSAAAGTGTPGDKGDKGDAGSALNFRGEFSASTAYFNNANTRDVVKYNNGYYLYKGTDNTAAAWSAGNWESFGSSWSSVATGLLLAERATINNLYVSELEGIPVPAGDLAGEVITIQNYSASVARVDKITIHDTSGTGSVTCNNVTETITWQGSTSATIDDFIANKASSYTGMTLAKISSTEFTFTSNSPGQDFNGNTGISSSFGSAETTTPNAYELVQIDFIIFTGTGGVAQIDGINLTKVITFSGSLENTVTEFVADNYSDYLAEGVEISASGETMFISGGSLKEFTSPIVTNLGDPNQGGIRIEGNNIYENSIDEDQTGTININRKGYNGGFTRYKRLIVGDGRGNDVLIIAGNTGGAGTYLEGAHFHIETNEVVINGANLNIGSLPTSSAGLETGQIYRDGNTLKIVT